MTEFFLVAGGMITITLMVLFAIKPALSLGIFYGILPLIFYFSIASFRIPGSSATIALGGVVSIFILAGGTVYLLTNGEGITHSPGAFWFVCFLIISGLSVVSSYDTIEGLKYWIRLASLFVLYLLTVNVLRAEKEPTRFVNALLIGLAVPMALGFYQFLAGTGMQDLVGLNRVPTGPQRIYGSFHIPNVYAAYLALPIFLTTVLAMEEGISQSKRVLYSFLACASTLSLFLTYTRSAWLGVFAGFLYIGFKKYKRLLLMLFAAVVLILVVFSAEQLRFGEIQKNRISGSGRLYLWQAMWPVAMDEPLTGHGLANTPRLVKKTTGYVNGGQSEYYKALLESGFPGLVSLLCMIGFMFRGLRRVMQTSRGNRIAEPLLLSIIAYFIASVVIAGFENFTLLENFFLIPVGVGIGLGYATPDSEKEMPAEAAGA